MEYNNASIREFALNTKRTLANIKALKGTNILQDIDGIEECLKKANDTANKYIEEHEWVDYY